MKAYLDERMDGNYDIIIYDDYGYKLYSVNKVKVIHQPSVFIYDQQSHESIMKTIERLLDEHNIDYNHHRVKELYNNLSKHKELI